MSILNFLTEDELDDLSDDPRIAFMTIASLAQKKLDEKTQKLNTEDESDWYIQQSIQHSYMSVIIASAKQFGIQPFSSKDLPTLEEYRKNIDYREFQAEIDHYITQLILENRLRYKRDSVALPPKSKDNIRSYLNALRECVEKSSMNHAKREALLNKLDMFQSELEKRRLNVLAVAKIVMDLIIIPGGVWGSYEVASKLINNIMLTVAEAKASEQETRQLVPMAPPKALSPPRSTPSPDRVSRASSNFDLDDDLPF